MLCSASSTQRTGDCSTYARLPIEKGMSFIEESLIGRQIHSVHVDSEVSYIMLSDGTQVTIRGWVVVERGPLSRVIQATVTSEKVLRHVPRIVGH